MKQIGCVPYLNARPLIERLEVLTKQTLWFDHPAGLSQAMQSGKLAVGMLPVVAYLENANFKIIPGISISCRGEVGSVKVFSQVSGVGLEQATRFYLDPDSRTSQKLLKVLLVKKYHRKLEDIQWVDQPEAAEWVLVIGDRALTYPHQAQAKDLGLEWYQLTGLPFVFACWMSLGWVDAEMKAALIEAKIAGLEQRQTIAEAQTLVPPAQAFIYLTQQIQYDLGPEEQKGLELFFNYLTEIEDADYDSTLRFVA